MTLKRICVFCGSSPGSRPEYAAAARRLGGLLAWRKIGLVFGGGRVGMMGHLARAARERGGEVIGVIPRELYEKQVAFTGLSDLRVVGTMHERKALMAELADGFIALPGGIGTYEEFFEVLTWAQLGIHNKPCALLNVDGFYDPVLRLLDHAVEEGFIPPAHRGLALVEAVPARLLDALSAHTPPRLHKWIDKDKV